MIEVFKYLGAVFLAIAILMFLNSILRYQVEMAIKCYFREKEDYVERLSRMQTEEEPSRNLQIH